MRWKISLRLKCTHERVIGHGSLVTTPCISTAGEGNEEAPYIGFFMGLRAKLPFQLTVYLVKVVFVVCLVSNGNKPSPNGNLSR
jgi:hypothetical protein